MAHGSRGPAGAETTLHDMPMPRSERTDYLALDEVAAITGSSESALEKLIGQGRLDAIDAGGLLFVRRTHVELLKQYLENRQQEEDCSHRLADTGVLRAFAV